MRRALSEHLNPLLERHYGLELRAFLVLSSVHRGVRYPTELADKLNLPKDTTSRTLQTLLKMGLIEKSIDLDDSRRIRLSVTAAGNEVLEQVRATLESVLEPLLSNLESGALEHFLTTTETLTTHLLETLGEGCATPNSSR